MPRHATFAIAPEDKRNITVTLKLTERENSLLSDYATQLESDRSYVAGKIIEAFVSAARRPSEAAPKKPGKNA
jgi:hypothetical protein